jgi:hypothetical protein
MKKRVCSLISVLLVVNCIQLWAQSLNQAKNWYLQRDFIKSMPVFKRQIDLRPKDPSLNLWYGACLLETGKPKEALSFLQFAYEKAIPDALFYLSKYYSLSEAPDSALILVNQYLSQANLSSNNKDLALELKTEIEAKLTNLNKVEDITFIDSLVVLKSALYTSLKLSPDAGNMVSARVLFPDAPKANGSAYLPERNDRALYGNGTTGKGMDIIARHRLLNDWDGEESLSDAINTTSDEMNPWLLTDGTTLYFASNRPSGYGGYDLYVTRMGKNDKYLLPDHLNMPFNSAANDFFLVIDEFKNRGYLATDRNQPKGYAVIYTFIPNPETKLVQGKSLKELQDLATIRSIEASQKGKNLDSLIKQPDKPIQKTKMKESDIIFTLNDTQHCYSEEDFVSTEARTIFKQYVSQTDRLNYLTKKLLELRTLYINSESTKQNSLSPEILQSESELLILKTTIPTLENKIRTIELTARTK